MPIYEYKCERCGHKVERFQDSYEEKPEICEKCGGLMHRVISRAGFVLKGSGWYVTDYPSKSRKEGMEAEKKAAEKESGEEKEKEKKHKKT